MIVKIYALERQSDGKMEDTEIGSLSLENGKVVPSNTEMKVLASIPLIIRGGEQIKSDKEPKRFLENMYLQYYSAYCRALKPEGGE